jgi:chemosensory pili system protein ChpA (sensor histidine kinase/response regulator)
VNAQRILAAAAAGRVAPREVLPEEAHLSSLVKGLETPDQRFSRLAAEKAEAERIEAERKAALAAAAAQSQAAKDRAAAAAAAAEAERLRRLAEEANKPKRRVAGFDLIMKEQSGSHAYDHENAQLVETRKEADAAKAEYDRMQEKEEQRRKGFIVAEEDGEGQQ